MNRRIVLICLLTQNGKDRMPRRGDGYVGTEHGVISDVNMRIIHKCQIEVCVDLISEMHMFAPPMGMKGRFDVAVAADFRKHCAQQLLPPVLFGRSGCVECIEPIKAKKLLCRNFRIVCR